MKELKAGIRDVRLKEVNDRTGSVDTDIAADRHAAVDERLREPDATTEVEHVEATKITYSDVLSHMVDHLDRGVDRCHRVADGVATQLWRRHQFVHLFSVSAPARRCTRPITLRALRPPRHVAFLERPPGVTRL